MKNKDIALLLAPSLVFILIAVGSLLMAGLIRQSTDNDDGAQKFNTFVQNVQTGKWRLTTDRWIDGMRQERAVAESYRQADSSTAGSIRIFACLTLLGVGFQAIVVLVTAKKLRHDAKHLSGTLAN
jgi:hypothetical protein